MNRSIGIAGMGWLGLPLAQHLLFLGHKVKGSVTKLEKASMLQENGFEVYPVTLSEQGVEGSIIAFLKEIELLIVMIPPGLRRNTGADYVLKMTHFLSEIEKSNLSKCIFISSTSVYGNAQGNVSEAIQPKPETEAGRQLLQVEQLFFNASFKTSIIRFGGLTGGNRQPVKYLAGRTQLSGGTHPVNMIHRNDCIGIITAVIQQDAFGHIFNAVHPHHPLKKDYYTHKARELNLPPPIYNEEKEEQSKKVDSIHIGTLLDYTFQQEL